MIPCHFIITARRAGAVIQILPLLVPLLSQVRPTVNNGEGISSNPFLVSPVQPKFEDFGYRHADMPFHLPDHLLFHLPSPLLDLIINADRNDYYGYLYDFIFLHYLTESPQR